MHYYFWVFCVDIANNHIGLIRITIFLRYHLLWKMCIPDIMTAVPISGEAVRARLFLLNSFLFPVFAIFIHFH